MTAIAVHLLFTLLPGYLLVILLDIRRQQLLFSVVFSCALLIVLVSMARNYLWNVSGLLTAYLSLVAFLSATLLFFGRPLLAAQGSAVMRAWGNAAWRNGLLATAIFFLLWYTWTGPYTEVPADLYRHLEFTRIHLGYIQQDSFGPPLDLWHIVSQHGGFWYVLIALESHLTGTPLAALLGPVMGASGLFFLLAMYLFGYRLADGLVSASRWRAVAALLGAVFVAAQMGTSAFSFVRYYSLAPVILNFIVFLAAQVCLLDLVAGRDVDVLGKRMAGIATGSGLLWVICFGVALIMHNQEGLFILLMALGTGAWLLLRHWLYGPSPAWQRMLAFLVALVVALLLSLLALIMVFDHAAGPQTTLGRVVPLPWEVPGFGSLYILNPFFQFARTVAPWGALVIVLFVGSFSRFRHQPWLVAGMLMPLVTVFNPIFVDLYLRIEGEHSLWRLLFLMPLYQVAAIWVVWALQGRYAGAPFSRWWRLPVFLLLLLLVLPLGPPAVWNPHARITNLPVPVENSDRLWADLVDALNRLPDSEQVLTDPVTGYVLSALTSHRTFRYKFFADDLYQAFPFRFESYDHNPLSRYRHWLLVVNLRDGLGSESGRRSGHWPQDILQVSRYYPANLRRHLEDNPGRFQVVWRGPDIVVYRILR